MSHDEKDTPCAPGSTSLARVRALLSHISSSGFLARKMEKASPSRSPTSGDSSQPNPATGLEPDNAESHADCGPTEGKCPFRTIDGGPPGPLRQAIPDVFDPQNTDPKVMFQLMRPLDFFDELHDTTSGLEIDPSLVLPGPLQDKETFPTLRSAIRATLVAEMRGESHLQWEKFQRQYGSDGLASNICVPGIRSERDEVTGERNSPFIVKEVILAHPDDCERIARVHVRKQTNFTAPFYGSIISTTDNDSWRHQRAEFTQAFLPVASLSKVFPVSLNRSKKCAQILCAELQDAQEGVVDMNNFLLHETQAQLQLAMFGETEDFMNKTNDNFRSGMNGTNDDPFFVRDFCLDLVDRASQGIGGERVCPVRQAKSGNEGHVQGPLGAKLATTTTPDLGQGDDLPLHQAHTKFGNALIFAFAGHDTTGHTLSWLLLELAKQPELQAILRAEIITLFEKLKREGGRDMTYFDLPDLKFMTRCIMETLRLWPAVANGTFRQLQHDDFVMGPDGAQVKLSKGTHVRVATWPRHRNPNLWGPDVNKFNPHRDFRPEELWFNDGLRAYNPHTERFSPFTHPPRDCIGKNFAQMEMRTILCHLLRDFDFRLAPDTNQNWNDPALGLNHGTLGPKLPGQDHLSTTRFGKRFRYGLPLLVVKRNLPQL